MLRGGGEDRIDAEGCVGREVGRGQEVGHGRAELRAATVALEWRGG
jgi:hypothetical protein